MRHLPDGFCRILSGFLHGGRLCGLSRRLRAVLTAHVLRRQLVGFFHECHLLVHRGASLFSAFQFGFERGDAFQQFVHLRIVVLRLLVEVAECGIEVTVGSCRGLDGFRRGLHRLFRSAGLARSKSLSPSAAAVSRSNRSPNCCMARLRFSCRSSIAPCS